jgi:hypothetical protein
VVTVVTDGPPPSDSSAREASVCRVDVRAYVVMAARVGGFQPNSGAGFI